MKQRWKGLVSAASLPLSVAGTFLLPPAANDVDDQKSILLFGRFLVAIVVGFLLILKSRWGQRQHTMVWIVVSGAAAVLVALCLYQYRHSTSHWTIKTLNGKEATRIVIGREPVAETMRACDDTLKEFGQALTNANRLTCVHGDPSQLWTPDSIWRNAAEITAWYFAGIILTAIAVVAVLQALHCNEVRKEGQQAEAG